MLGGLAYTSWVLEHKMVLGSSEMNLSVFLPLSHSIYTLLIQKKKPHESEAS